MERARLGHAGEKVRRQVAAHGRRYVFRIMGPRVGLFERSQVIPRGFERWPVHRFIHSGHEGPAVIAGQIIPYGLFEFLQAVRGGKDRRAEDCGELVVIEFVKALFEP